MTAEEREDQIAGDIDELALEMLESGYAPDIVQATLAAIGILFTKIQAKNEARFSVLERKIFD